jgi:hypothetical protein
MNDIPDDDQPTDPGSATSRPTAAAPWSDDGDGHGPEETLRTVVVALAGLAGVLVVVSVIGLVTYRPRKNFIHRHPLLAEVLGMGRHPF